MNEPWMKLRPTIAHRRLGARDVGLVSLATGAELLKSAGKPLLVFRSRFPWVPAPLLRAARDWDALIGLQVTALDEGPGGAHRCFEAVAEAAEGAGHRRPFVLLPPALGEELEERAESQAQLYVEAGFSGLCLSGASGAAAAARVIAPAAERELGILVVGAAPSPELASLLSGSLAQRGGAVAAPSTSGLPALWQEPEGWGVSQLIRALPGAGAQGEAILVGPSVEREAQRGLSGALRAQLAQGASPREVKRALHAEGEAALDLVEAPLYLWAGEIIEAAGLRGTGLSGRQALSEAAIPAEA